MSSKKQHEEAKAAQFIRNTLLVAGQEMGAEGDHWPVIKSTIQSLMQDQEELKVERNVQAELKQHLYAQIEKMEKDLAVSSKEDKAKYSRPLKELREVFDAYFDDVDESKMVLTEDQKPMHLKRMEMIIETMEAEDEQA